MYKVEDYTTNLHGNITGGMTAAVVALPLALAFGIASGAGPVAGLYGAVIVGLFAAIFGGTATQISGPTGPMTVVMTAMISSFLAQSPENGLFMAFSTVCLGGLLQIIFGWLRLGKYIVMVPYPVISGFMSGIGIIIIVLQTGPILGFPSSAGIIEAVMAMPAQINGVDHQALGVGILSLIVGFAWRGKASRVMPAPLLALILATLATELIIPGSPMARIGAIPSALPSFQLPTIQIDLLPEMLSGALMLAILGSIDSLLTSLVADNVTGTQHDSDRELIGQGIGNTVAGLFGGLPGAGATMRTIVNIKSGGSGPLSGVIHAIILLFIVIGIGFLFESIPLAALAGILIKVGIDIIDWAFIKRVHRLPVFSVLLMVVVLLLTVFVDLITAVFVGVFIKNMVTISQLSEFQLGSVIMTDGANETDRLPEDEAQILSQYEGKAVLVRLTGPVCYAANRDLIKRYERYKNRKLLLIDIDKADIIGISTAILLEDLINKALGEGAQVKLIGIHGQSHHELRRLGLIKLVGKENCVGSTRLAFDEV